ncbi:MAG: NrdH-redoxin [Candidatus Kerfeldbacteria bacterium RIFCSPHIGHO2_02_FULL_42_14]|uniref:NrdH-redoxin n=1 Tax=Candidatus Kerfeldbacteria bacterium RIFCSPHIGHO2_02_FULL_42_14 TaxID=1798540 RepID=A0A1G2ATV0_9BACT|nr:MAG: NrdH-redoxin [Candidatus Kerfeldbacteria bacterium RIFCSPHIGHO2_02_FULL_42_14]OGY81970.1 MAG: NrdH-redoxin [Candidatus Kerfeldbacteria bacterium RIFCSPHIGHO2_12_FULL_42_13]OGY83618.1 MAG: NrdH-redoxin [Candidatus Kerfeldbacteria bacterium RIFCSPLOWO2_02_FULL_42_19]OGY87041.1 MAG: NrdH-redoxin [Candidatus Kerfeldbacteria bacterium RIFCSPLOWO2_12_FULL_43_9]
MANVTIYTTPTCAYCKMTKSFFKEHNVTYKEIDVASDAKAAEVMIQKSGQMGVPVTVVEKEGKAELIVGFDQDKLSTALGIS